MCHHWCLPKLNIFQFFSLCHFFPLTKSKPFFLFCLKSENVFSWSLTKWRPPWLSIAWLTRGRENQLLSLKLLQCCSVTRTKCIRTNLKCLFLAALQYFTSVSSHWVYIRCMNSIFCQCYFFCKRNMKMFNSIIYSLSYIKEMAQRHCCYVMAGWMQSNYICCVQYLTYCLHVYSIVITTIVTSL